MYLYGRKEGETWDIERHREEGQVQRDWSYAATSQGKPAATGSWKRQGMDEFFLDPPGGAQHRPTP